MSTKIIGARYIGEGPCPVRLGDRAIAPGEAVTGPEDVIAALLARDDFEAMTDETPTHGEPQSGEVV